MQPEPALRARLRRALLRRGQVIATTLAEVLADEHRGDAALTELGVAAWPGIRPEEALRKALDQIEARRALLDAGDDRYGQCAVCGVDLGQAPIVEQPWADRCAEHAGAAAA
jgi:RNA polymerase-binding transcription factor DksA